MKNIISVALFVLSFKMFAQEQSKPNTSSSLYLGGNYSVMKNKMNYVGFLVGIQTMIKDTHLLAVEINHLVCTNFKSAACYGGNGEINTETNYEITYGRVLQKAKNEFKFILQSGIRMEYIKYQVKYIYSKPNYFTYDEPLYVKKSIWQPALPVKFTAFWCGKHIGKSLGLYANIGKYTDFGIRFTIHLLE